MSIEMLVGKKIKNVTPFRKYLDEIVFETECGEKYRMYHDQDCCENVSVEDICGDIEDLIGETILKAYSSTREGEDYEDEVEKWTFYHIVTNKTSITIRWYGSTDSCYSIDVEFERM